ncbi:MAG: NAD(P)-dependent oxidoreductase [Mesorhizobium sp.]
MTEATTLQPDPNLIGFVGLGNMGWPMAAKIVAAGYRLMVFDTRQEVAEQFAAEQGCLVAQSPADLRDVSILTLMLPNGKIVESFLMEAGASGKRVADRLGDGAIVVDMSSSRPMGTRELGKALAALGVSLVDAPVSGGVPRAKTGTLSVMTGGDAATVDRLRPLLGVMASTVTHCGDLGAGHAMKALNNYVSAAGLVAACEALRIAQEFGIDGQKAIDVLNASTGRNNTTEHKLAQQVLNNAFKTGFTLGLMRKDVDAAVELAGDVGVELLLGKNVLSVWEEGERTLGPGADHTAIAQLVHARTPHPV